MDEASWLTRPFWEAAREGVLVRPVCDRCGRSFFTPQIACPFCGSLRWTYVPSTGRGAVYSHTTVHRAPGPEFTPPYVVAVVDLDEGWSMLTNVVGCDPAAVAIGMRVEVTWRRFPQEPARPPLPAFRPRA